MHPTIEPVALIGPSACLNALRGEVEYASRCDAKVLITGESGVGKEVVARLIHASSRRNRASLITVNCAALTETLLETELFGHDRGSFTDAIRDRTGVLEQAHRGTVFMDEVGETTPRMQGLLLRFMETGEIQRVGSNRTDNRVDVRVIAATNRNLLAGVQAKTFREDLYYRLNVVQIHVPPLRERMDDLLPLLQRFLHQYSDTYQRAVPTLSPAALTLLLAHSWPGNVRELKNLAERLVVRGDSGQIEPHDLPLEVLRHSSSVEAVTTAVESVVDQLFNQMVVQRQSFWTVVHPLFMTRDLTRDQLRELVRKGLERGSGSYAALLDLFNVPPEDLRRFVGFLKKYQCQPLQDPLSDARRDTAANAARLLLRKPAGAGGALRPDWRALA